LAQLNRVHSFDIALQLKKETPSESIPKNEIPKKIEKSNSRHTSLKKKEMSEISKAVAAANGITLSYNTKVYILSRNIFLKSILNTLPCLNLILDNLIVIS